MSGFSAGGTRRFLGIPYAAATAGALRWKPPEPVTPWTDELDATEFGHACPQSGEDGASEDCLVLNVWTPDPAPVGLVPTMVWIHGGGFNSGTAHGGEYQSRPEDDPYYDGNILVERMGVVVVSMNYRLGPFGFLAHPDLAEEDADYPAAGNYGILDQRAALEWVQRNIAAFGGDPNNVTIFGESAGGSSVCMHLVSSGSRGLFHRAILESGGCSLFEANREAATARADALAEAVDCADAADVLECLRSKAPEEILGFPAPPSAAGLPWIPVLDGVVFPRDAFEMLEAGDLADVPVLAGANGDEGTLFQSIGIAGTPPETAEQYEAGIRSTYGDMADTVLALYPVDAYSSPARAAADIYGDRRFVCPNRRLTRATAAAGNATFRYTFTYDGVPGLGETMGAFHGSEIRFVFGTPLLGNPITTEEEPLRDAIQAYWTRFAETGDPNGARAVLWPEYTVEGDEYLVLDRTVESGEGLKTEKCDLWDAQ